MTIIADQVFAPGERVVRGTSVAVKVVAAEGREGAIMIPGTMHSVQGRIEMRVDPETGIAAINLEPNTGTPANNYYQWITQVPGTPPVVRNFEAPDSPTSSTLTSGVTLPASTIPVADATSFAAATPEIPGLVSIGGQIVLYTGKTGTTLTGATGGEGTFALGTTVTQGYWVGHVLIDPPAALPTFLSELLEDEIADRIAAVSAEASARAAAIAAEAATRADVDADLLADLTSEVNRATAEEANLAADIVSEATTRAAAVTAEATTREAADAAELLARSTGALAQYRPVSGGASTTLPADLVLPTDGSTFDLPLVTLTNPAAMTESWTVVDPDLIAGSDGDAIQTFTPAKGLAFTQATSAKRPTIRRNVIDGHSTLRADGVDDAIAQAAGAAKVQPNTYLVIAKTNDLAGQRRLVDSLSGATAHVVRTNASKWEMLGNGQTIVGGATTGAWRAVHALFNGASSSIALDGGTATSGDIGSAAPTGLTLFANPGQTGQPWNGDLAYLIALASANAALVLGARRWLAERFPSVPVLSAAETPTNAWYPEGYARLGTSVVVSYESKTANTLKNARVVTGSGTVLAGATVTQVRPGSTSADSVRLVEVPPLVGKTQAQDGYAELVAAHSRHFIDPGTPQYGVHPNATPLYNKQALNQAIADGVAYGEGATIYQPKGKINVDCGDGSQINGGVVILGSNIRYAIPLGSTIAAAEVPGDRYTVIYVRDPATNVHIVGGGRVLGDQLIHNTRPLGNPNPGEGGTPQIGHCIRFDGVDNFSVAGVGGRLFVGYPMGDCIYVGEYGATGKRSSRGRINAVHLHDARREGFAPFNCDDIEFTNFLITDIGVSAWAKATALSDTFWATGPGAGIDVEPNTTGVLAEVVRRLIIANGLIKNTQGRCVSIAAGGDSVIDVVQISNVMGIDGGFSDNDNADDCFHFADVDGLQLVNVLGQGGRDAGFLFRNKCRGTATALTARHNETGIKVDPGNTGDGIDMVWHGLDVHSNKRRGMDLVVGSRYLEVNGANVRGNGTDAGGHEDVRIATNALGGGRVRLRGGRINPRRVDGSAATSTYALVVSGANHLVEGVDLPEAGTVGKVNDTGTGTVFRNCPGFPTSFTSTWVIPSGSTFVDVPHGMGRRPRLREVSVSFSNSGGNASKVWVPPEGITDTHIRVQVNVDPGPTTAQGTIQATALLGPPIPITATHRGDLNDNADLASYPVTVAVAPTANRQVLVFVGSVAATTPNIPTLTGLGITNWTQVATSESNNRRGTVFKGSAAAPTSGTLTVDFAGQTQLCCEVSVDEILTLGPGPAPVTNTATGTSIASAQTFSIDGSGTYMAVRVAGNEDITEEAGWTRLYRNRHTTPNGAFLVAWRPTGDTTPSASWAASVDARIISLELLPTEPAAA